MEMIQLGKISLNLSDFNYFVGLHLRQWPNTREIEKQGKLLSDVNFKEQYLINFIRAVCNWGNYAGIAQRILNQNDLSIVQARFKDAWRALSTTKPNVSDALIKIIEIKNLGTPSFASKHLRFLCPQICPVLDSVICEGIGTYSFNSKVYEQFSRDCLEIANVLNQSGIVNPMKRENGKWFAADVEMAVFEYLWSGKKKMPKTHCRGK